VKVAAEIKPACAAAILHKAKQASRRGAHDRSVLGTHPAGLHPGQAGRGNRRYDQAGRQTSEGETMRNAIFLLMVLPSICLAQEQKQYADLPIYDPQKYCKGILASTNMGANWLMQSCLEMEQAAYDRLKEIWPSVAQADKKSCLHTLSAVPTALSYDMLNSCILMEQESKEAVDKFKFKR
jgi:hypothetical protein